MSFKPLQINFTNHKDVIPIVNGYRKLLLLLILSGLLSSCSVVQIQKTSPFQASSHWIMLPIINHSDTPEAGARAVDIAQSLLRIQGLSELASYLPEDSNEQNLPELDQEKTLRHAKKWAIEKKYTHAISGSVQEWRYKSGLDAEPAVGMTLTITDLQTGKIIWTAAGSRTGWGRESVSGVAHKLMADLMADLEFRE